MIEPVGQYDSRPWANWGCTQGIAVTALLGLALSITARAQFASAPIETFGVPDQVGMQSSAPLIRGSDGNFYGTTYSGGGSIRGTVFKMSPDGSTLTVLHRFSGRGEDGAIVFSGLIEGSDGSLYGTTAEGGAATQGTVFKLNRDGSGFTVLHSFAQMEGDGRKPYAGLVQGGDDGLYGTTRFGGSKDKGTVFRLEPSGTDYRVIHHFATSTEDGSEPVAKLVGGSDGALYGTTFTGGTHTNGTVFRLGQDGTDYRILRHFTGTAGDGAKPYAELCRGADGLLYGSTVNGGTTGKGTLFRLGTDGSGYEVLHRFGAVTGDGTYPYGPVIESDEGILHGTAAYGGDVGLGGVFTIQRDGSGYRLLRSFAGGLEDGAIPFAGLVRGDDAWLYGTTWNGGRIDRGTVFRVQLDGSNHAVLRHFTGTGGDVADPYAGLAVDQDGMLYGTSWSGGNAYQGTVFKVNEDGSGMEILHHFDASDGDGRNPYAGVIEGSDGLLYGATVGGGGANLGTLFKLNKDGSGYSILRSFTGFGGTGSFPYGRLCEGSDGLLYGTTLEGGNGRYGTVFKVSRSGANYSVIRHFLGGDDGASPYAGVIEGSDGWLYGTTAAGGGSDRGTVFRLRKGGSSYTVLRRFAGDQDALAPYAPLLQDSDGALFGASSFGGSSDLGTVFRINTDGSGYQLLHQFAGSTMDGANALGGVVEGPGGRLYGVTELGGAADRGVVFSLDKDGGRFELDHHFGAVEGDGEAPNGELTLGISGSFYGITRAGGIGCGTVFGLVPAASLAAENHGEIALSGPLGFSFALQHAVEPGPSVVWQEITNVTITSSPVRVAIPDFGSGPRDFYRAIMKP